MNATANATTPASGPSNADRQRSRARKHIDLPTRFVPQLFRDLDQRYALAREVQERVETLQADTGAESIQKKLLCERAVFVSLLLEDQEVAAINGSKTLDAGSYVQMANSLLGLLRALGLERKAKSVSLANYLEEKSA